MNRRIGKFLIPGRMVADACPEVTRIMGMCSIFRAEHMLASDHVEYVAISFKFREVQLGERAPRYEWVFSEDGGVEAVEVDEYGFRLK